MQQYWAENDRKSPEHVKRDDRTDPNRQLEQYTPIASARLEIDSCIAGS